MKGTMLALILLIPGTLPAVAEEAGPMLALTTEGTMNTRSWGAFGGGLALGWDINGTSLGARAVCNVNGKPMRVLETFFFARFYLPSLQERGGFFAQLEAGPGFIFEEGYTVGTVSAGLMTGWRFLLGRRWFVEPFVRAGYPFIVGGGVGTGLRL
jgi:hypothetical protein